MCITWYIHRSKRVGPVHPVLLARTLVYAVIFCLFGCVVILNYNSPIICVTLQLIRVPTHNHSLTEKTVILFLRLRRREDRFDSWLAQSTPGQCDEPERTTGRGQRSGRGQLTDDPALQHLRYEFIINLTPFHPLQGWDNRRISRRRVIPPAKAPLPVAPQS